MIGIALLFALACGVGPDDYGLWEVRTFEPFIVTQQAVIAKLTELGLSHETVGPDTVRFCARRENALNDVAHVPGTHTVRRVYEHIRQNMIAEENWTRMQGGKLNQAEQRQSDYIQAQQWVKDQADRMEHDNATLRASNAEVERLTAQLEAATKELQALAQEQARRHASMRWYKPWSWGR